MHRIQFSSDPQLDRPVWAALSTRLRKFAHQHGDAYMMRPEFGPFAAARGGSDQDQADFQTLLAQSGVPVITMEATPYPRGPLQQTLETEGVQMLASRVRGPSTRYRFETLTLADAADIYELAQRCKPGPFEPDTYLLGTFIGLRRNGDLIAMAGQRLQLPGYTEISAVSVAPEARGQGIGAEIVCTMASLITHRGDMPFLHALASNTGAIALYERLGFRIRAQMHVQQLAHLDQCVAA